MGEWGFGAVTREDERLVMKSEEGRGASPQSLGDTNRPVYADIVEKVGNCGATGIAGPFDAMRLRCCEAFGHCRDDQLGEFAKVLGGSCE